MRGVEFRDNLIKLYLNATSEGVYILDGSRSTTFVNDRYLSITGVSRENCIGQIPSSVLDGWHDPGFYNRLWDSVESKDLWEGETWDKRVNDDSLFVMNQKVIRYQEDGRTFYLGIVTDITSKLQAIKDLQYHERIDPTTNITNRSFGEKNLKEFLDIKKERVAVILLDINNFSSIPETFGHSQGDEILKEVAFRIKNSIGSENIFNFSQDRFVLYFSYNESDEIEDKAFEIIDSFHEPYNLDDNEFFLSVNLGISLFKTDGIEPEELIRNADSAMQESRKEEFNTFSFYKSQMNDSVLEQFQLIGDLRKSIEREELNLVYQPQIDTITKSVVGAESLLRWDNGSRGKVSPDIFIPLAEKKGLITPIGEWVLRNTCNQFLEWKGLGISNKSLAINISGAQFHDKRLLPLIKNIFYNRVDTSLIELEITESAFVDDIDLAIKTMSSLKDMGFKLAIDDFGTGFSSLSYLKRFPIDKLKIDKSFVDNILEDPGDKGIVKSIITLAQNLDLKVIAEGVETNEQKDYINELGCPLVQGYLYSKPLTGYELGGFFREATIL